MKKTYKYAILAISLLILSGCKGFLDQDPDRIMSDDEIFSDPVLIESVIANFYGRLDGKEWGQNITNRDDASYSQTIIDDAAKFDGGPDTRSTFEDDRWRTYDYELIRNINQFLQSLRATSAVSEEGKKPLEGEARFIRAWTYFVMCRGLGGMPIVGDEVFDYVPGMDATPLQKPRATEAAMYDYIISECRAVFDLLPAGRQVNNARANKWTAKMLEARAAVYAASLANYNNKMANPIKTTDGEVGIPADLAEGYYKIALAAADTVIKSGVYILQDKNSDKGRNFYEATSVKETNTEVIWVRDYKYPGQTVEFTKFNIPRSHAEDIDNSYAGPVLNLVEEFEPVNTDTPGKGEKFVTMENGTFKFYDSADAPFKERDPRLWGSVIYPGATFRDSEVVLQTGQLVKENGEWKFIIGDLDSKDANGNLITSFNGPKESNEQYINKSGFYFRKYLDETPLASTRGRNSEMWWIRFRIAEAYMIAAEASFELNNGKALEYINAVRSRAGVKELTTLTFDNIVHEYRVEFAFEDHRYWDLKRWRLADKVWDGNNNNENARHRRLWPYRVVAPGDPNHGKWVFVEDFLFMSPNARYFEMKNYYNFLNMDWINNNPKLKRNPYQ